MTRLTTVSIAIILTVTFALLTGSSSQAAILTAYYDFEGDFLDAPGAGVATDDLTNIGAGVALTTDVAANAKGSTESAYFAGQSSTSILHTDAFTADLGTSDNFTIMFWIKADDLLQENNNTRMMSTRRAPNNLGLGNTNWQIEGFGQGSPNGLDTRFQNDDLSDWWFQQDADGVLGTNGNAADDVWYHVAMVFTNDGDPSNNAHGETFVNGVSLGINVESLFNGQNLGQSGGQLIIGGDGEGAGTRDFTGFLDDVALFDGLVADADILAIAQGQLSPADFLAQNEVVPEPSTFVIWSLGLVGLAWYARRRRTK